MFDVIYDMFARAMLVGLIIIVLLLRLAMKHPKSSGNIATAIFRALFGR